MDLESTVGMEMEQEKDRESRLGTELAAEETVPENRMVVVLVGPEMVPYSTRDLAREGLVKRLSNMRYIVSVEQEKPPSSTSFLCSDDIVRYESVRTDCFEAMVLVNALRRTNLLFQLLRAIARMSCLVSEGKENVP